MKKYLAILVICMTLAWTHEARAQDSALTAAQKCFRCRVAHAICKDYTMPVEHDAKGRRHGRRRRTHDRDVPLHHITQRVHIDPDDSAVIELNDSTTLVVVHDSLLGNDSTLIVEGDPVRMTNRSATGKITTYVIDGDTTRAISSDPDGPIVITTILNGTDTIPNGSYTPPTEMASTDTETDADPSPPVITTAKTSTVSPKPTVTKQQVVQKQPEKTTNATLDPVYPCDSNSIHVFKHRTIPVKPGKTFQVVSFTRRQAAKLPKKGPSYSLMQAHDWFEANPKARKITFKVDRIEIQGCIDECKMKTDIIAWSVPDFSRN